MQYIMHGILHFAKLRKYNFVATLLLLRYFTFTNYILYPAGQLSGEFVFSGMVHV